MGRAQFLALICASFLSRYFRTVGFVRSRPLNFLQEAAFVKVQRVLALATRGLPA